MIIVKLIGGLGNQMFQYALAFSLAERTGSHSALDITGFQHYTLHRYSLDHLKVNLPVASDRDLARYRPTAAQNILRSLLGPLGLSDRIVPRHYIRERHLGYDPRILQLSGDYYLDGYWQSERYFRSHRASILSEFRVTTAPRGTDREVLKDIERSESIAVHVRRGDYATNPQTQSIHGLLPWQYYLDAFAFIKERVTKPRFFIFSDDLDWVRRTVGSSLDVRFVDHNTAATNYEDLRLMSACKHQIIANSSFSWWAGWLNPNPDKTVIAPKRWFTAPNLDATDLVPAEWVRL